MVTSYNPLEDPPLHIFPDEVLFASLALWLRYICLAHWKGHLEENAINRTEQHHQQKQLYEERQRRQ
jgi:hypothetical protein